MGQTLPECTTRSEVVRGIPVKHLRNSATQGLGRAAKKVLELLVVGSALRGGALTHVR